MARYAQAWMKTDGEKAVCDFCHKAERLVELYQKGTRYDGNSNLFICENCTIAVGELFADLTGESYLHRGKVKREAAKPSAKHIEDQAVLDKERQRQGADNDSSRDR